MSPPGLPRALAIRPATNEHEGYRLPLQNATNCGTIPTVTSAKYATDKSALYRRSYDRFFDVLQTKPVRLLELGVFRGGSLRMWRDYFNDGLIVGLDINPVTLPDAHRIRIYQGRLEDIVLLDRIGQECAPSGFDIIIDDASHVGAPTWASFWHLFDHHLKPGGIYCIEDWRVGYWPDWADGASYEPPKLGTSFFDRTWRVRSHDAGLVGVVKALVDELGADMITHPTRGGSGEHRLPRFARLEITPGQAFIVKATGKDDDLVRKQAGHVESDPSR